MSSGCFVVLLLDVLNFDNVFLAPKGDYSSNDQKLVCMHLYLDGYGFPLNHYSAHSV